MTAPTVARPLYPRTYGGFPRCAGCWQRRPDLAMTVDPRTDELEPLCGGCGAALRSGRDIPMPTREERAQAWEWLAIQHHNQKVGDETGITDEHIDRALASLASEWLPPQVGWEAFEALQDALLRVQAAEDPATVLDGEVTGGEFDAETYVIRWRGIADGALAKLAGGRS